MNVNGLAYMAEESNLPAEVTLTTLINFTSGSGENHSIPPVSASLASTRFVVQTIVTPVVVTVGLLGNLLNILVLVQPTMRTSTNVYLLTLALADIVYLVFSFTLSFVGCRRRGLSYAAYAFNTYGRTISDMAGNIAVWIIVIFTVERYVAVCHPMYGKVWCTVTRAKLFSSLAAVFCLANTAPGFFELEVRGGESGPRCHYTAFATSPAYELGYTWWYVTIFTFVPFVFLLIFNSLLIHTLVRAARDRELMLIGESRASRGSGGVRCCARLSVCRCSSVPASRHSGEGDNACCGVFLKRSSTACFCVPREGRVVEDGRVQGRAARSSYKCGDKDGRPWKGRKEMDRCCSCVRTGEKEEHDSKQDMRLLSVGSCGERGQECGYGDGEQRRGRRLRGEGVRHCRFCENHESGTDSESRECVKGRAPGVGCEVRMESNGGTSCVAHYGATEIGSSLASAPPHPSPHSCRGLPPSHSRDPMRGSRKSREQHKVTLMLTVIVIIFLLCQLPWTVLYLYRAYLSAHNLSAAGSDAMKIAGNVVNLLAQANASGNFYLYSFFSKRFRRTLARLFLFWKSELSSSSVHL